MVSELERALSGRSHEHQAASLVKEYRYALVESFGEVFGVDVTIQSDLPGVEIADTLVSNTRERE